MERKEVVAVRKKIGEEKRTWLVSLYKRLPMLFLDEAKARFQRQFHLSISTSHLCTILHEEGLVRKVLEILNVDYNIDIFYTISTSK